MIASDSPTDHPDLPGEKKFIYEEVEGRARDENRVTGWRKEQEIRPGKFVLWDHCFELPHKHLEAEAQIQASVPVGKETHKLKVSGVDKMEIYDGPGEYAQRYDGVGPTGKDQPEEVQKVFQDNERTATLRMDEETSPGLVAHGETNVRHLRAGHAFELEKHFNADGEWVVLPGAVEPGGRQADAAGERGRGRGAAVGAGRRHSPVTSAAIGREKRGRPPFRQLQFVASSQRMIIAPFHLNRGRCGV